MVVLDTCALIEACKTSPTFSKSTIRKINSGGYLLSISFAEIACKVKLGKLEMAVSPRTLFFEFSRINSVEIIDIGVNEWLDSIELEWHENRDPADRVITAFAMQKHLPIVTSDKKIKEFYNHVIW